jgi:hypothetical protein
MSPPRNPVVIVETNPAPRHGYVFAVFVRADEIAARQACGWQVLDPLAADAAGNTLMVPPGGARC